MEVVVTLTPTDEVAHSSDFRQLTLNKDFRNIEVGRGSKNPRRGLKPAYDNAIFDCPIMSRQHARFSASPVIKTLYVLDCKSTHGTFLDGKKVDQDKETIIKNGQTVTFGVRVVNGATTYGAKSFRVEYYWRPRVIKNTPQPESQLEASTQAPNGYNKKRAVSSEPSLEIVESNVRTTYSVPSDYDSSSDSESDDELLQTSSPPRAEKAVGSCITTPDHELSRDVQDVVEVLKTVESNSKPTELKLKGPALHEVISRTTSIGSSQIHPINIEIDEPTEMADIDGGSPDILPEITRKRSDIVDLLNEGPPSTSGNRRETLPEPSEQPALPPRVSTISAAAFGDSESDDLYPFDVDEAEAEADEYTRSLLRPQNERDVLGRAPSPSDAALAKGPSMQQSKMPFIEYPGFSQPPYGAFPVSLPKPPPPPPPPFLWSNLYNQIPSNDFGGFSSFGRDLTGATNNGFETPATPSEFNHGSKYELGNDSRAERQGFAPLTGVVDDDQVLKPHISNLINSPSLEGRKSLKRKADQISSDDDIAPAKSADNESGLLHDAQPRDVPVVPETETFVTQGEPVESIVNSAKSPATEPPQKKAKTTSSSRGVGKFISGVCLGVVGAAVAFIATIPASVHEEAWREL